MDGLDIRQRPAPALVAAGALLAGFAILAILVALRPADPPLLGRLDRGWQEVALGAAGWVRTASEALKALGSGFVMVPLRLLVAGWLLVRRRHADLAAWLLAWAVADALTFVLKPGIGRLRPDGADATSFPSGHAKTAAQVAFGLALLATAQWPRRWTVTGTAWLTASAWVVAMAISRTVLDEHWLSDVVAGSMLGAACSLGAFAVVGATLGRRASPQPS